MSLFKDFEVTNKRPLPVFFLIDTSGSMTGEKIEKVNLAFKEMLTSFKNIKNNRGELHISVITFGGKVDIAHMLSPLDEYNFEPFKANGGTPMGEAFELVTNMIEDESIVTKNSFSPIIVLLSDGLPTDLPGDIRTKAKDTEAFKQWDKLEEMQKSRRVGKSIKLALGIGKDANMNMLKAYVNNNSVPVFKAHDASVITTFFEWVTMSVSVKSINPENNNVFADQNTLDDMFAEGDYEL